MAELSKQEFIEKYPVEGGFKLCGFRDMSLKFKGNTWSRHPEYDKGFKEGQQSKQAEIDKRLSDYQLEISQVGQACVRWKEVAEGKQAEVDVLNAKLNDLTKWAEFHIEDYNLGESDSEYDRGWFNAACQVLKKLKGD